MRLNDASLPAGRELEAQMRRASRAELRDVEAADRLASELAVQIRSSRPGLMARLHDLNPGGLARLLGGEAPACR